MVSKFIMYILVSLKETHQKRVIPLKWIKDLTPEKYSSLLNVGARIHKNVYTVFYSPNHSDEPDFGMNVTVNWNKDRSGCYFATILRGFGKILVEFSCGINSNYIQFTSRNRHNCKCKEIHASLLSK